MTFFSLPLRGPPQSTSRLIWAKMLLLENPPPIDWVTRGRRKAKVTTLNVSGMAYLPRILVFCRGATESHHGQVRGLHGPFQRSEVGHRPSGLNRKSTHKYIAEKYGNSSVSVGNSMIEHEKYALLGSVTRISVIACLRHALLSSRPRRGSATVYRARSSRVPIGKCGEYTHAHARVAY